MNSSKISGILSVFIILGLVMTGPASALQVKLLQPLDINNNGGSAQFTIVVDIEGADRNVPVTHTDLKITGPNGFSEICRVYNDGSYDNCGLDLRIYVEKDVNSIGYGYGYSYGYNFGYGYGYNDVGSSREIVYYVTWHPKFTQAVGIYSVEAETHAGLAIFNSGVKNFNINAFLGPQCANYMQGYRDARVNYDSRFDLDNNSVVNVIDLGYISQNLQDENWCNNRFHSGIFSGLVAHYELDGNAYDSSGYGRHGTLVNNPTFSSGVYDKAISLDGINQYIDTVDIDFVSGSFTISAWIKQSTAGVDQTIISKRLNNFNDNGRILLHNGNVEAYVRDSNQYRGAGDYSGIYANDNWHHVVMVVDTTNVNLFVDGNFVEASQPHSNVFTTNNEVWRIGAREISGGNPLGTFSGEIDDVRIYDRALNSTEIIDLFNA